MRSPAPVASLVGLLVGLGATTPTLRAQVVLANPNFEAGRTDSAPSGWVARGPAGYRLVVVDSGAFQGRRAALLEGARGAGGFAVIRQSLAAAPLRGRDVRYRAFVRAELSAPGSWTGLWLRVDRPDQQTGFIDNMQDRPITAHEWRRYEITGDVADDATAVVIGVLLQGAGRVWVDSVTLEALAPGDSAGLPPTSAAAVAYLDRALEILQQHSINRARVDWPALRTRARARIAGAQRPADTYRAIRRALTELGDRHSFFLAPQGSAQYATGGAAFADSNARLLEGRFGYVRIPEYGGGEPQAIRRFAAGMHDAIRRLDGAGACGWIVDLRGNGGGNMWPMLAGIGPVLGDGVAGSFVVPGQGPVRWEYRDGAALLAGRVQVPAPPATYRLRRPAPPVAVLTDRSTGSSGEAVAVAFRGLPNARSFGEATAGLSSANENYALPDSAMILLTVALDADRTGTVYGGPLAPDQPVPSTPGDDAPLAAALRWLGDRCRR